MVNDIAYSWMVRTCKNNNNNNNNNTNKHLILVIAALSHEKKFCFIFIYLTFLFAFWRNKIKRSTWRNNENEIAVLDCRTIHSFCIYLKGSVYPFFLCNCTFLITFSRLFRKNTFIIWILWRIEACSFQNWQHRFEKFKRGRTWPI